MSDNQLNNVLLVDDDDFIQDIYATKFKADGIDIAVAEDGEVAIEELKNDSFDVVLLDIIMPGTDGMQFLEQARNQNLLGDSLVIVLSNQGQKEDIEKANQYDVDGYIVKASSVPSEVLAQVQKIYNSAQ